MVSFIVCIISMGCTKTEMTKQEQTGTEQLTAVSEAEALTQKRKLIFYYMERGCHSITLF